MGDDEVLCRGRTHRLPKGTDVAANYWFIHRDPVYWERADEFVPSRWADVSPTPHGGHYAPFSKGPRGCPGQRVAFQLMKASLAAILSARELRAPLPSDGLPLARFGKSVVLPNTPESIWVRHRIPRET